MRAHWLLLAVLLVIAGCGGGGGGGSSSGGGTGQVVGRVLNVETGGPPSPPATVQAGSNATTTSPTDGSFILSAPAGTTSITVDTQGAAGVWTFAVPTVSGTVDAGDLWVGPQRVTLSGRVLNATTGLPVSGATISFGGRTGVTNSQGQFVLNDVAYSSQTQTAFWGIVGTVRAQDFVLTEFTAAQFVAVAGDVNVGDILLTPGSDDDPPSEPFNIVGRVLPLAQAPGTVVTLKNSQGNAVRVYNVGPSGTYNFWVTPGTYTVSFQNGTLSAPSQTVTVDQPDEVEQVPDVTLG